MADIFVSYGREDVDRARALVERFIAEGWSVFWDAYIPGGEEWRRVLYAELAPAACVVVLWSSSSITSTWVDVEASEGVKKGALIPARLDAVTPPPKFRHIQATDLTRWNGSHDSDELARLLDVIAARLGRRRGVSVAPVGLYVVVGRPSRHPDLGATLNMTCRFVNKLRREASVLGMSVAVTGPAAVRYHLDWRLPYEESPDGREHKLRLEEDAKLSIAGGGSLLRGIQFRAPFLSGNVTWPAGVYVFKVRGWVNRDQHDALANLKCDVEAGLPDAHAAEIVRHLQMPDAVWQMHAYSDDAYGVPFEVRSVRSLLAAT